LTRKLSLAASRRPKPLAAFQIAEIETWPIIKAANIKGE
jgi:hypothetical protein